MAAAVCRLVSPPTMLALLLLYIIAVIVNFFACIFVFIAKIVG